MASDSECVSTNPPLKPHEDAPSGTDSDTRLVPQIKWIRMASLANINGDALPLNPHQTVPSTPDHDNDEDFASSDSRRI
ncbi:hypothetical protein NW768_005076 [Fusarium equiseti]|uniref:Uncharacterized protein n=1 Tax=Fusarium equiseti TaxID=61235 RepID=A0ABQ8REG1_FUSEQ|nr:hypothetical protein NW768_005076 [Fusarium equiseti]